MTALERQLTTALRVLSAQYAHAQQQAAQGETLRQQVDTLEQQGAQLNWQVAHLA